jgi:hypothetical protein
MIGTRLVGGCQTAGGVGTAAGGGAIDFLLTYLVAAHRCEMCGRAAPGNSGATMAPEVPSGARAGVFSRMM